MIKHSTKERIREAIGKLGSNATYDAITKEIRCSRKTLRAYYKSEGKSKVSETTTIEITAERGSSIKLMVTGQMNVVVREK